MNFASLGSESVTLGHYLFLQIIGLKNKFFYTWFLMFVTFLRNPSLHLNLAKRAKVSLLTTKDLSEELLEQFQEVTMIYQSYGPGT